MEPTNTSFLMRQSTMLHTEAISFTNDVLVTFAYSLIIIRTLGLGLYITITESLETRLLEVRSHCVAPFYEV